MKKNNVKIKENITLMDQIHAIESITSSYFTDGEYTPYFAELAAILAILRNFITGIEFKEGEDIYDMVQNDDELRTLINQFLIPPNEQPSDENHDDYYGLMAFVNDSVVDKVSFLKQMTIHK